MHAAYSRASKTKQFFFLKLEADNCLENILFINSLRAIPEIIENLI